MAQRKADQPKEVLLVGPTGDEISTGDPTALNNLVYGMGYRVKSGDLTSAETTLTEQAQQATGEG